MDNKSVVNRYTASPVDGLYNQLLFSLCGEKDIVSLALTGKYNPAIDAIGVVNTTVQRIEEDFVSYVAPSGYASGEATSGVQADPCADAQSIESGSTKYILSGFGRIRRASPVRDLTENNIKYCETQPIYTVGGQMIENDYMWDVIRINTVMLQDLQRELISGTIATSGSHSGLLETITYGYTNPETSQLAPEMDSIVIDWNSNQMCSSGGATGVTYNGNSVTDGYSLVDIIKSALRIVRYRVQMSSISGQYRHIGLLPLEALESLIDCYACQTACGGQVVEELSKEQNETRIYLKEQLKEQLGMWNVVQLMFDGVPVTFFPYGYELLEYDSVNQVHLATILIVTPTIGNRPVLRLQMKDMSAILLNSPDSGKYVVSDQNRVLSWSENDNTCYKVHSEFQWRWYNSAPWAQIKITNVQVDIALTGISDDPLSPFFPVSNPVANPAA